MASTNGHAGRSYTKSRLIIWGTSPSSLINEHLVAFLGLDIDYFKRVNDTYAHQAGDEVLRAFVQTCKQELRDTGLFGRIGGENLLFY